MSNDILVDFGWSTKLLVPAAQSSKMIAMLQECEPVDEKSDPLNDINEGYNTILVKSKPPGLQFMPMNTPVMSEKEFDDQLEGRAARDKIMEEADEAEAQAEGSDD